MLLGGLADEGVVVGVVAVGGVQAEDPQPPGQAAEPDVEQEAHRPGHLLRSRHRTDLDHGSGAGLLRGVRCGTVLHEPTDLGQRNPGRLHGMPERGSAVPLHLEPGTAAARGEEQPQVTMRQQRERCRCHRMTSLGRVPQGQRRRCRAGSAVGDDRRASRVDEPAGRVRHDAGRAGRADGVSLRIVVSGHSDDTTSFDSAWATTLVRALRRRGTGQQSPPQGMRGLRVLFACTGNSARSPKPSCATAPAATSTSSVPAATPNRASTPAPSGSCARSSASTSQSNARAISTRWTPTLNCAVNGDQRGPHHKTAVASTSIIRPGMARAATSTAVDAGCRPGMKPALIRP